MITLILLLLQKLYSLIAMNKDSNWESYFDSAIKKIEKQYLGHELRFSVSCWDLDFAMAEMRVTCSRVFKADKAIENLKQFINSWSKHAPPRWVNKKDEMLHTIVIHALNKGKSELVQVINLKQLDNKIDLFW